MILTLLIFIPVFVGFFWMHIHALMAFRTDTFWHVMAILLSTSLYLFFIGCYSDPSTNPKMVSYALLVAVFAAPFMLPSVGLYLRHLYKDEKPHPLQLIWVPLPISVFTAAFVSFLAAGTDNITAFLQDFFVNGQSAITHFDSLPVQLFYYASVFAFRILIAGEGVWFIIYLIIIGKRNSFSLKRVWDFIFHGGRAKLIEVQIVFSVLISTIQASFFLFLHDVVSTHIWISLGYAVLLTITLSNFAFIAMFSTKRSINVAEMMNCFRYNCSRLAKPVIVEGLIDGLVDDASEEGLERIHDKITAKLHNGKAETVGPYQPVINQQLLASIDKSWEGHELMQLFQKLMMEEKLFLQPSLTLQEVAERLGTNKTFVSKLVNNAYNVGFPELINTLRVDYAEQYILANRDAKQTEIAEKCGFLSASSFNNIFKKVTGMTPSIWKASIERSEQQTKK